MIGIILRKTYLFNQFFSSISVKSDPHILPGILRIRFIISHFLGADQKCLIFMQGKLLLLRPEYTLSLADHMDQIRMSFRRSVEMPRTADFITAVVKVQA